MQHAHTLDAKWCARLRARKCLFLQILLWQSERIWMVSINQANCLPFTRTYEHIYTRARSFSRSYVHYVKRTWIILFFSFDILFTPVFVPYNYWFPKSYIKLRMNAEESVQKDEILTIKWDFVRFSLYKLAQLFAQWYRFSSLAAGKRVSFNTHHFFPVDDSQLKSYVKPAQVIASLNSNVYSKWCICTKWSKSHVLFTRKFHFISTRIHLKLGTLIHLMVLSFTSLIHLMVHIEFVYRTKGQLSQFRWLSQNLFRTFDSSSANWHANKNQFLLMNKLLQLIFRSARLAMLTF